MSNYRAYIVGSDGSDGHFHSAKVVVADDDAQALQIAEQLVDAHEVELWQLDRKVGVLRSKES